MRAPDGFGEAPAGRPGERKMLFFRWFYRVFTCPLHLAFSLVLFARVAKVGAERRFPRPFDFPFSHVFSGENVISEGHLLVAHAHEAGLIISQFPISPRFLEEKCEV